ncbi:MAG: hypothetical protein GY851_01940 [bacterium]|nr:hypothetical protein [bacterium]
MRILAILLALTVLMPAAFGAEPIRREDLGRTVKFTCVVDKVMQPENKWVTEEWMVRESAEAGFNIYSPRTGHENLDAVRQVTAWCQKYGIFHLPWMRGTLAVAMDDAKGDGKRMVWANGGEQAFWSPCADEFWEWTNRYIVEYAKMSAENNHIIGVFLDYENYAPGTRMGNAYGLSYDDLILGKFAAAQGVTIPKLPLGKRKGWLDEQGLHDAFEAFQVAEWRARCRALRQAVDEHDPRFQFWLYPVPATPFLEKGAYMELGTEQAPIVVADQSVYGRPSEFLSEQESLKTNREKLLKYMEIPKSLGIPFLYSGGIDPVVRGADPEFSGKNAVMISETTDGYWIFYEGPKYKEDHPEYFKWFAWANKAIAEGRFERQREPRKTTEPFLVDLFKRIGDKGFTTEGVVGRAVTFPPQRLRHGNLLLVACEKGTPVEIRLRDVRLGNYDDDLSWELRSRGYDKIENGMIPHAEEGVVRFEPEATGVHFVGVSSGQCAYTVVGANVPVGIHAGKDAGTIGGAERLYFYVPAGTESFKVHVKGAGGETARVNVYNPEDAVAGTGQTTLQSTRAVVPVKVGDAGDAIWSLSLVKADEGALEDASVRLEGVPGILALDPSHVFRPAK